MPAPEPTALADATLAELQRRHRQQRALAELASAAIVARDVASLLPRAKELLSREFGDHVDVDELVDAEGRLFEPSTVLSALPADDQEFVAAVAQVFALLAGQREHERLALSEVQGRFARTFQMSPVALAISTISEGRILEVNEQWLSVFGYQRHEVIGRTNAELRLSDDAARSEMTRQIVADGIMRGRELKVRTKAGLVRDITASAAPVVMPGIDQEVWLSAIADVTDRKRAEAERDEMLAREQLARAEAEQALEHLRAVYAIADSAAAQGPLGELLGAVLRRVRQTLQVDHASVLLLDDDRKTLSLRAMDGVDGSSLSLMIRVPLGAGVSGRVAAEGRSMIVNDYSTVDSSAVQAADRERLDATASVMAAPFYIGDRVAGVVVVSTRASRLFTDEELRLLELAADRVGPAIERGRLIDRIRTGIERQRSLSWRLLTAQEEERRRLAVELHDELGQVLTAVKINLESLSRAKSADGTSTDLTVAIQSVDEALLRVRDIALDLRPSVLDDLGLAAAIRWYVDRFARAGPLETHLSIGQLPALEAELATACFRVAQEALTNIDRHARARQVWIDLHVLDGALELSIRDDGVGFDVHSARARAVSGGSVGLLGMQERVSLVDGEFAVVQVPAGGIEVHARFPLSGTARS
jgi:PAS domain S-box-containing protein